MKSYTEEYKELFKEIGRDYKTIPPFIDGIMDKEYFDNLQFIIRQIHKICDNVFLDSNSIDVYSSNIQYYLDKIILLNDPEYTYTCNLYIYTLLRKYQELCSSLECFEALKNIIEIKKLIDFDCIVNIKN